MDRIISLINLQFFFLMVFISFQVFLKIIHNLVFHLIIFLLHHTFINIFNIIIMYITLKFKNEFLKRNLLKILLYKKLILK